VRLRGRDQHAATSHRGPDCRQGEGQETDRPAPGRTQPRSHCQYSDVLLSVFSLFEARDTVEMYRFDFEAELGRVLPETRMTLLKLSTDKLGFINQHRQFVLSRIVQKSN